MAWGLELCWFESEQVSIGADSFVNAGCYWFEGHGRIVIGRDCFFGPEVVIVTSVHASGPGVMWHVNPVLEVRVSDSYWLEARDDFSGGEHRHGNARGRSCVLTRDREPGDLYVGVPARRVR